MFTGIIQQIGKALAIDEKNGNRVFTIFAEMDLDNLLIGASLAIDGVCQTVIEKNGKTFKVEAMPETLRRTTLGTMQVGAEVNLERPIRAGDFFDGHFAQGHVDDRSQIIDKKTDGESVILTIKLPADLKKFVAFKGSITINGVSLTVTDVQPDFFSVNLIPHTLKTTNLSKLETSDLVNLEVDMMARYLERLTFNN